MLCAQLPAASRQPLPHAPSQAAVCSAPRCELLQPRVATGGSRYCEGAVAPSPAGRPAAARHPRLSPAAPNDPAVHPCRVRSRPVCRRRSRPGRLGNLATSSVRSEWVRRAGPLGAVMVGLKPAGVLDLRKKGDNGGLVDGFRPSSSTHFRPAVDGRTEY